MTQSDPLSLCLPLGLSASAEVLNPSVVSDLHVDSPLQNGHVTALLRKPDSFCK